MFMIVSFIEKGNTSINRFFNFLIRVPTYLVLVIKLNKKGGCFLPQQCGNQDFLGGHPSQITFGSNANHPLKVSNTKNSYL